MEKNHKALVILFVTFLIISVAGFSKSYVLLFPRFENVVFFTHIHFIIFLTWFALLIWQPILISRKNYILHRKIGRLSYILAPVMVISILIMVKLTVANNLSLSKEQGTIAATGAILDAISFSVLYTTGMINKHRIRNHVACVIGASLIILNPGLGRLVTNLTKPELGILAMVITPLIISLGIISYEKFRLKRIIFISPYFLIIAVWIAELALFIILPKTEFWQGFIVKVAAL